MYINTNNEKDEKVTLIVFIILIALSIVVKDKVQYIMFIQSLYAALLTAVGIIIIKTIKFNPNRGTIFLGLIFTVTGSLETGFILTNLGTNYFIFNSVSMFFYMLIEILQLLGIYFSLCIRMDTTKKENIFLSFVKIAAISLLCSIAITYIFKLGIREISLSVVLENSITILTLIVCSVVFIKISNMDKYSIERYFIARITFLFIFSRIIMLTLFILDDIINAYFISRCIMNISIYYLYKYIVYINIKKPYQELNNINKVLKEKANILNYNNERLIQEVKRTQMIKDSLRMKNEKLKATINSAMNPTIIFSDKKDIIYKNKSFITQFSLYENCNISQMLKFKFKKYEDILISIDYVIKNNQEVRLTIESNDFRYYQVMLTPFEINGQSECCLCIFIDKTKEMKFEKEIVSTNLCYENFLESVTDGIILLDGYNILYANNECINMFDGDLSQIDLFIEENQEYKEDVYIINGREMYVDMIYSTYNKNKKSIVIRDITERKLAQKRLRESEESYSKLIDILPDGICLLDRNLDIKYLNKSLLNIINVDEWKESNNFSIRNIIKLSTDEEVSFLKNLKKVINNNQYIILLNKQVISKNNECIDVEINALPFSMGSDSKYVMLIIKDLTDKKTTELVEKELSERLEIDKIKTEFFTNMSHELKTPLNVIFSSNQLLESFYKNKKINDYNENVNNHIALVKNNSYRLQRLINNIIDLTKLESGYYKLNLSKSNIVALVEDLFMKIEKYAKKKNISLIFDTESEEINMFIDEAEIERIMLNLLSNCIKFTPDNGEICVNIYDKDKSILISVKNTGVGIPKDKLNIIFDEFSQVDKTLSRNTEGSGIGLSLVKKLVELHNGTINVQSEENKETEFIITLNKLEFENLETQKNKSIYDTEEKINIEFSDIYY
ncbi:PAS domain S-box protein [Romboutsia ilealis]|uniref:histidine kinase n=1 Tax=Romboutsia faecis TaxID=2764597 RepID=A0ABR7JLJ8_9FIRM|nr:ATP-binding protein [Romboutsia faecis]MBC5995647.1 PAS domain S-box protein [Romboutsia faecis]MRN23849.1 PAS domain S-box protein [Romboutsia ilealis]